MHSAGLKISAQASTTLMRPATIRSASLRREAFSLGKSLLDRVHVRAKGRRIAQFGPGAIDEAFDPRSLVCRQIVHGGDIAWREGGRETFFHPFLEPAAFIVRS